MTFGAYNYNSKQSELPKLEKADWEGVDWWQHFTGKFNRPGQSRAGPEFMIATADVVLTADRARDDAKMGGIDVNS